MLVSPSVCETTTTASTTAGRYVNLGVDPCAFDAKIASVSNFADCVETEGVSVDISAAIPWYGRWGIPQNVNFSGRSGAMRYTVHNDATTGQQYFISLDSDWLYAGIKDTENNFFIYLGTGSPAYYEDEGDINISAYSGPLTTITQTFEAIQVRDQGTNAYIERIRANATHVWYQKWASGSAPLTPAEVDSVKDSPGSNRCLEIGTAVVSSKYVPFSDCVTAFGATDVDNLNLDSNYTLKIIDMETAASINFSASLGDMTETSCAAEEEAAEEEEAE